MPGRRLDLPELSILGRRDGGLGGNALNWRAHVINGHEIRAVPQDRGLKLGPAELHRVDTLSQQGLIQQGLIKVPRIRGRHSAGSHNDRRMAYDTCWPNQR